jgi:virulence-associated protein VagC
VVRVVVITMVIRPMRGVPVAWRRGIIGIRISGVRIVVNVRMPVIPVRIIIEVARRTVVPARKSKTEALSSGNQDSRLSLSMRKLDWNQEQSAYRQSG